MELRWSAAPVLLLEGKQGDPNSQGHSSLAVSPRIKHTSQQDKQCQRRAWRGQSWLVWLSLSSRGLIWLSSGLCVAVNGT